MPHKAAYDGKNRSGWKPVVSTAAIHLAGLSPYRTSKCTHAATWADDIKAKSNYTNDQPRDADAGQNVGYSDHHRHAFWHFKDTFYSPDGTALPSPDPVDAVTQ